jgi:quercetin dioxygenase-like cupin family protein
MTAMQTANHYRWTDVPQDHPIAKLDRRLIRGKNAMIAQIVLHAGCYVPRHSHENEQFACVLSGELRFSIGEEDSADGYEVIVRGGEVLHLPSNVPHAAEALRDTEVLDIFSPPADRMGVDQD